MDDYGGLEKRLKNLSKRTDAFLQGLIDEHRRKEEGNTINDHMLSLQKPQPEYYTDQIVKGLILVSAVNSSSSLLSKSIFENMLQNSTKLLR